MQYFLWHFEIFSFGILKTFYNSNDHYNNGYEENQY